MQAVQLDQLLPQIQTVQSPQDLKTGDTSFMDELRKSIDEIESSESVSDEKQKTALANKKITDIESEDSSEITSETDKTETRETYIFAAEYLQEKEPVQMAENVPVTEDSNDLLPVSENQNPKTLTEKQIQWLYASADNDLSDENFSDEDFARMIDAAIEFIPGEASEEELLESAQNLASKDPEMFLAEVATKLPDQLNPDENKKGSMDNKVQMTSEKRQVKIEVKDLRTAKPIEQKSAEIAVSKTLSKKELNLTFKKENENSVQVTMNLAARAEENITSSNSQAAGASSSTFQSMLANTVQQNAPEFVKAGSIVLKDNNQGSINLIVQPEKLGNVKINLSLSDKVISGQITVHSKEAYDAMKDSIASLKEAFRESGFQTGEFNLNLSNSSSQGNFAQSQGDSQYKGFMAERVYGDLTAGSQAVEPTLEAAYSNYSELSVNIVA